MEKKRLTRSDRERKLLGVCGGIAEYLDTDPTLVRVGWLILACVCGVGILAYLLAAFVMPSPQE